VAGPNGSGKSSVLAQIEFEGRENLVEADAIAKRMNPLDPSEAAIAAAREAILQTRTYLAERRSFAIETTLSGNGTAKTMSEARALNYSVRLIFVCLAEPERNLARVQERVARGGHDVPDGDIRRRYERSLANLPAAVRLAHEALFYDNSGPMPRKVLETRNGAVTWQLSPAPEPAWVTRTRLALQ
jgi:predicted ABC-type ATPase